MVRPRLAWWRCAGSLVLMAAGLALLASRQAEVPAVHGPLARANVSWILGLGLLPLVLLLFPDGRLPSRAWRPLAWLLLLVAAALPLPGAVAPGRCSWLPS